MSGNIVISPVQAQLTRDTEAFGKMDPYVVIGCGAQSFKTAICSGGGKNPGWKESFTLRRTNEELIDIQVWDYDSLSKNDMVGEGYLPFSKLASGKFSDWVDLGYKGKGAGKILITAQFYPDVKSFSGPQIPTTDSEKSYYMDQVNKMQSGSMNQQSYTSFPQTNSSTFPQQTFSGPTTSFSTQTTSNYPQQSFPTQPTTFPQQGYPIQTTTTMPMTFPQQTYPQQTFPMGSYPTTTYPQQTYSQQSYPQQTYPVTQNTTMYPQQTYTQPTYTQPTYTQPTYIPVQQNTFYMQPTMTMTQQQPVYYPQPGTVVQVVDYTAFNKNKYKQKKNRYRVPIIGRVWSSSSSS